MQSVFTGPVYVVRDNIDTDQIISAQYLNLVPTIPEEYEKLGSHALAGLPESLYVTRYVKDGQLDSEYPIVVAGKNFGCGSSREHAPIALGSANCQLVLAESFARIFFRNCVATGELYPCESADRLCDILKTGDVVTVEVETTGEPAAIRLTADRSRGSPLGTQLRAITGSDSVSTCSIRSVEVPRPSREPMTRCSLSSSTTGRPPRSRISAPAFSPRPSSGSKPARRRR